MRPLTRRRLLQGAGVLPLGGLMSGLLPGRLAAASTTNRKFLFVFCTGGWDPTWVYAPKFGSTGIDVDPTATTASIGGIDFVDSASRPAVRSFFERYAPQTCVLNGFEVRSVTHERCRRLVMTGTSNPDVDDWPSTIAGNASGFLLPHLVISGPAYTSTYTTSVMRVGESGQLSGLIDGSALFVGDIRRSPLSDAASTRVSAFLDERLAAAATGAGRSTVFLDAMRTARDQRELVRSIPDLDLHIDVNDVATGMSERVVPALTCFERGYSKCAIVQDLGLYNAGWDSHSDIEQQSINFEVLFEDLNLLLQDLETRIGTSGRPLSEEVVVVVLSEMGRSPKLNATGGKDHWTFTSAMVIGPGVRGGTVVGGYDDDFAAQPVDLASGAVSTSGTLLTSANLGATLLALADVDPGVEAPIEAMLA